MKISLLIPTYRSVEIPAYLSMLNLINVSSSLGEFHIASYSDCNVVECRNQLANMAAKDADVILMIDSDIVFSDKHVKELLDATTDYELVSGVYPAIIEDKPQMLVSDLVDDRYKLRSVFEDSAPIKADSAGLGFCAIKGNKFRDLMQKYKGRPFATRISKHNKFVGEDNVFFERCKEIGLDLWLYPKIRVGHAKW